MKYASFIKYNKNKSTIVEKMKMWFFLRHTPSLKERHNFQKTSKINVSFIPHKRINWFDCQKVIVFSIKHSVK